MNENTREQIYDLSPGVVRLVNFYNKHDDVYERLYDFIQDEGPEAFGGPGFQNLDKQEQYDIWRNSMGGIDVKDAFIESYQKDDIEHLGDKMAQYYVDNGIMSKSQFWLDVETKGGQKVFEAFNRFVFKGIKEA